jgi:small nuclear ribonucleoprotein (snRNP)-like protein
LQQQQQVNNTIDDNTHDEKWYELRSNERMIHDINMLSSNFNPIGALNSTSQEVEKSNPWMMEGSTILDNIEKFVTYLPEGDPLRRNPRGIILHSNNNSNRKRGTTAGSDDTAPTKTRQQKKQKGEIHPLDAIMGHHSCAGGPISSVLYKLQKKRIRIVVRYVNAIRGTITGTLLAFDKHMNMMLRDVEEIYSPRPIDLENEKSNVDLELDRRRKIDTAEVMAAVASTSTHHDDGGDNGDDDDADTGPGNWNVKKRTMKQLLVRGDMVVSIYEADQEKKIVKSRYHSRNASKKGKIIC